jgi:phosphoinositide-3-kinase regulatory subunit 4
MGNKLARTTQVSPSEYYLHDLPSSYNLVLKEALGGGRLLKSVQCVHDEGLLLVKVYFKRGESLDLKVLSLSTWDGLFGLSIDSSKC